MIRRVVTCWVFVLGMMVVVTGPNVLVASMAGHMTGGDLSGTSGHYAMAELNEDQMKQLIGGQGCFGFATLPECCRILTGLDYVFKLWNRTGPTTLLFTYSATVLYTNYCTLAT